MKCPYCNNSDTKVIDSRPVEDGLAIRRRRECEKCKKRFTTFEKIENSLLVVVKNDGRRESFDRNKLINGLLKACEKTKITYEDVEKIAERIERALNNTMEKEIESKMIGALIMDELRTFRVGVPQIHGREHLCSGGESPSGERSGSPGRAERREIAD